MTDYLTYCIASVAVYRFYEFVCVCLNFDVYDNSYKKLVHHYIEGPA